MTVLPTMSGLLLLTGRFLWWFIGYNNVIVDKSEKLGDYSWITTVHYTTAVVAGAVAGAVEAAASAASYLWILFIKYLWRTLILEK